MKKIAAFIAKIGLFFSHLFSGAARTWKKLSPEIQNAMIYGSDIIDMINRYVDETPQFIIDLIAKKYPGFDKEKLLGALNNAAIELKIAQDINNEDLLTVIQNLQTYMSQLKGNIWAKISETLAKGIAVFFAPAGTKWAVFSSLMEFVYQTFIKKNDGE